MSILQIPKEYNYIGLFLTFNCNYRCSYCINSFSSFERKRKHLSGKSWVKAINRISGHLTVTLQGGEPTLHPDFYYIVNNIKEELNIDLLTNLQFDPQIFMKEISPERIKRDAPYASIRVSYHPETMKLDETLDKTVRMLDKGYHIGIWSVMHPDAKEHIEEAKSKAEKLGIDFRTKEFLGEFKGKLYGTYKYDGCCDATKILSCSCRTTELIVAPDGLVYPCHSNLYEAVAPVGDFTNHDFQINYDYNDCNRFGLCNPCDVKVKTNRFQQFGHTSVDIKDIGKKANRIKSNDYAAKTSD